MTEAEERIDLLEKKCLFYQVELIKILNTCGIDADTEGSPADRVIKFIERLKKIIMRDAQDDDDSFLH